MKKLILILFIVSVSIQLSAEAPRGIISGQWIVEPFIMEQDDGLLTAPEAGYSFPYIGINMINFLDSGFVVFTIRGEEYRAFYEIEELDFDNFHIKCSFKSGEEFLIKLVKADDNWKYFYRIGESSILRGNASEEEPPADDIAEEDGYEPEPPAESIYAGILKRK